MNFISSMAVGFLCIFVHQGSLLFVFIETRPSSTVSCLRHLQCAAEKGNLGSGAGGATEVRAFNRVEAARPGARGLLGRARAPGRRARARVAHLLRPRLGRRRRRRLVTAAPSPSTSAPRRPCGTRTCRTSAATSTSPKTTRPTPPGTTLQRRRACPDLDDLLRRLAGT
jgi:hypothetical protein